MTKVVHKYAKATIIVTHWGLGLICATLIAWFIGVFFISTPGCWEYDSSLKLYYPSKYTRYRHGEGFGWTSFGELGLQNLGDTTLQNPPNIIIWGDSHVEAGQVPGDQTAASVFNKKQILKNGRDRMIAWGRSGASLSTYCLYSPQISKAFPSIEKHYFVVNSGDFRSNELQYDENNSLTQPLQSIPLFSYRKVLVRFHLNTFWSLLKNLKFCCDNLRLTPGPVTKSNKLNLNQLAQPEDISKALEQLAENVGGPRKCCIVLDSHAPTLQDGSIIFLIIEKSLNFF